MNLLADFDVRSVFYKKQDTSSNPLNILTLVDQTLF